MTRSSQLRCVRLGLTGLMALAVGSGCRSALPAYAALPGDEALAMMRERNHAISCIASPCRLILTDEHGRSVQLGGALVAARDGRFRFQAWKLSRTIFDLTINTGGMWVWEAEADAVKRGSPIALRPSLLEPDAVEYLKNFWTMIVGDFDASWEVRAANATMLRVRTVLRAGQWLECTMATKTLTVQACAVTDHDGVVSAQFSFSAHRRFGRQVIPTRMDAVSAGRCFTITLDDPSLDNAPAPRAFVPPEGAVPLR